MSHKEHCINSTKSVLVLSFSLKNIPQHVVSWVRRKPLLFLHVMVLQFCWLFYPVFFLVEKNLGCLSAWDDNARSVELTVPFETSFEKAIERKTLKYEDVIQRARTTGYVAKLITLEVGSRGVINMPGFTKLKEELKITKKDYSLLLIRLSCISISESYIIWCKRNTFLTCYI